MFRLNDPSAMEAMDSCENVGPLDVSIKKENTQDEGTVKPKMDVDKYCAQFNNNGQVVEALKARIRELESVSKTGSDKFTCLLCKVSTSTVYRKNPFHDTNGPIGCITSDIRINNMTFFT